VRLGAFAFAEGQDAKRGAVSLLNDTSGPEGTWVSADAVRLGGGRGDIARGDGSGVANSPTSGRPRWEECSRYYAQFSGAPPDVWDYAGADSKDDVSARSRYAAWQNEEGEDAVYLSWHTNAPNPGRGTSTYVYGPHPPDGSYQFSGTEGSDQLAEWVHDEIVADIREAFDPSWKDRGIRSAYFGEVNPAHNPEMPAILVEVAFHDTASDADYLREPRFRDVVSRAFTQGLIRYFAARDGLPVVLPPGTPRDVRAWSNGPESITVAWSPPDTTASDLGQDNPAGYQIHLSHDGAGFHKATTVEGALEAEFSGMTPGVPVFFQVTAYNDGGTSPSSPVIPVIPPCDDHDTSTLLVQGFYRLDGASQFTEELSPWGLGTVQRHRQSEVNTYDYLVEHTKAFASARVAIDGAEATAIEDGLMALEPYRLVDWALGE
ncbi:MAG: N-acetylmuramoyl-L-alanine amidase, partial [Myxococcota bacterium]|nr:N-acetylmuramoyl-L-alanine amidase [Myxococcota bacterium]